VFDDRENATIRNFPGSQLATATQGVE